VSIFHFGRYPFWRKRELIIETPEVRREKSIVVIDFEGGNALIDLEIWECMQKEEKHH
jgi:hypothetical protein